METLKTLEKEQLIENIKQRPVVIGIEGGPSGGKTTFVESLQNIKSDRPIVVLPEQATEINNHYTNKGVRIINDPSTGEPVPKGCITRSQFANEALKASIRQLREARQLYYGTGAIVVADRVDVASCYISEQDYRQVCSEAGITYSTSYDLVDKILYFPTVARKDPALYETLKGSNPARWETAEQAVANCKSTLKKVKACPELHYVDFGDQASNIDAATQYVINSDNEFETGYFIDNKDANVLIDKAEENSEFVARSWIKQSYGRAGNQHYRIRMEGLHTVPFTRFSLSIKEPGQDIEKQRLISEEEAFMLSADNEGEIYKGRYRFLYTDPETGVTDVWCLDYINILRRHLWALEVERHNKLALASVHPPVDSYVDKFCSNHQLATLELMLS